ncbi:Ferric enterobactin esterase [Serratia fonticola]|uniref:Ferric enterobactin esterase n=1 Tax=Serratia fonticola TaxID=47917 RepID=A0A4U9TDF8_SERFO|nr:Ferric enterobactin esterase [Serratia fonticola]
MPFGIWEPVSRTACLANNTMSGRFEKLNNNQQAVRYWRASMQGAHGWWLDIARRGTPLVEPQDNGRWKVTFLWRDPQGGELTSAYQRVWIHINCLTDHHQASPPQSLQRLAGSDVWYWQTELQGDWRGSYCFIPCMEDRPFEPQGDNSHANMLSIRHWWHQVFARATHDLLNPYRAWPGVGGHTLSGLHMPQAPQQPAWRDFDNYAVTSGRCTPAPPAKLQRHTWHSQRLGTSRHVWIYSTGESNPAARPLAILLDGQFWANQMPVWDPLMQLTRTGQLPEAVYLLIDVIDQQHRARELTCNDEFWLALQEELLPQLADWAPHSREAANTVVSWAKLWWLGVALCWPALAGIFWCHHQPVRLVLVAPPRYVAIAHRARGCLLVDPPSRRRAVGCVRQAEGVFRGRGA